MEPNPVRRGAFRRSGNGFRNGVFVTVGALSGNAEGNGLAFGETGKRAHAAFRRAVFRFELFPAVSRRVFDDVFGDVFDTADELDRYCDRVKEIVDGGGSICGVQLYTVARVPSEPRAVALDDAKMDALAATIREKTGLPVDVFYSK